MPPQRRFRRLGTTSAAVSLGALTLVFPGAAPAGADAAKDCAADGIALKKVSCRLENITGETLELTGDITTEVTRGVTGGDAADPRPSSPPKAPAHKPTRPSAPRDSAPSEPASRGEAPPFTVHGVRSIQLPRPDGEPPATPSSKTDLTDLLPQPHVAAAPPPAAAVPPAPVDQLVSPVAAADGQQQTQLLAVAAAAALAGAVGALNLSVAGRRLRRSRS